MQLLTEEPGPQFSRDKLKPAIILQCQWSCPHEDDRSSVSFVKKKTEHVAYPLEGWRCRSRSLPTSGERDRVASQSQGWHTETTTHVRIRTYITSHLRLSANLRVYGLSEEEASGDHPKISVKQLSENKLFFSHYFSKVAALQEFSSLKDSRPLTDSRSGQCRI